VLIGSSTNLPVRRIRTGPPPSLRRDKSPAVGAQRNSPAQSRVSVADSFRCLLWRTPEQLWARGAFATQGEPAGRSRDWKLRVGQDRRPKLSQPLLRPHRTILRERDESPNVRRRTGVGGRHQTCRVSVCERVDHEVAVLGAVDDLCRV